MSVFLRSCCRICLAKEHIMIYLFDQVDEFDMTLSDLLETCVDVKVIEILKCKIFC